MGNRKGLFLNDLFIDLCRRTGVARSLEAHGQGTVRGPQTNCIILVGELLDPRGRWTLSTLSTHLLRPCVGEVGYKHNC